MDYEEIGVRRLSSLRTPLYKVVLPGIWLTGFWLGTLLLFIDPALVNADETTANGRWLVLAMVIVGTVFFYLFGLRLKTVELRGETLVISGLEHEITVPLREVRRFSGSVLIKPEFIWIHFYQPTEFGEKVIFLAPWRLFGGFTEHPLVRELNSLHVPQEAGEGLGR